LKFFLKKKYFQGFNFLVNYGTPMSKEKGSSSNMGKKNVESERVEEQRPHTLPRFPPVFSLDVPLFGGRRERGSSSMVKFKSLKKSSKLVLL
jgi:hypothetical protein